MLSLLLAALLVQDPAIEDLVRALTSDDIAGREKATRQLSQLPLEKLPDLEKHLKHPNAETAGRISQVMNSVLASNLGSRKARFELRPLADDKTQADWIAAGADRKKAPEGFEARTYHPKANKPDGSQWILVKGAIATEKDVDEARLEPDMNSGRSLSHVWLVNFQLKPEGAREFDKAAAELFPVKGKLGILLDGKILVAPTINAERFGGKAVIDGNFTEAEARGVARALKGDWLEASMRAEKMGGADAAEKAVEFLRGVKGFDQTKVLPDPSGLDIAGYLDTKEVDLVTLWQSLRERGYRLVPKK